jgi:hypothetical protein
MTSYSRGWLCLVLSRFVGGGNSTINFLRSCHELGRFHFSQPNRYDRRVFSHGSVLGFGRGALGRRVGQRWVQGGRRVGMVGSLHTLKLH